MTTSAASCSCASIPVSSGTGAASARVAGAWHRVAAAVMAWWPRRAGTDQELDTLVHLSDSVLRDIGVPDSLRAQAAQWREQEHMLRRLEARHGSGLPHW
jgi:hypothetical protein